MSEKYHWNIVFILRKTVKLFCIFKHNIKFKSEYKLKGIIRPGKTWLESTGIDGTRNV